MAKAANGAGGFTFSPRPKLIAVDSTTRPLDRVAMIGGMRSRRISSTLPPPTAMPAATAASRPGRISTPCPSITSIAMALPSAMVDGIDRSMLPGPSVITSIWPNAASTAKAENASAAVSSAAPLPPSATVPAHTAAAAR